MILFKRILMTSALLAGTTIGTNAMFQKTNSQIERKANLATQEKITQKPVVASDNWFQNIINGNIPTKPQHLDEKPNDTTTKGVEKKPVKQVNEKTFEIALVKKVVKELQSKRGKVGGAIVSVTGFIGYLATYGGLATISAATCGIGSVAVAISLVTPFIAKRLSDYKDHKKASKAAFETGQTRNE